MMSSRVGVYWNGTDVLEAVCQAAACVGVANQAVLLKIGQFRALSYGILKIFERLLGAAARARQQAQAFLVNNAVNTVSAGVSSLFGGGGEHHLNRYSGIGVEAAVKRNLIQNLIWIFS